MNHSRIAVIPAEWSSVISDLVEMDSRSVTKRVHSGKPYAKRNGLRKMTSVAAKSYSSDSSLGGGFLRGRRYSSCEHKPNRHIMVALPCHVLRLSGAVNGCGGHTMVITVIVISVSIAYCAARIIHYNYQLGAQRFS
ncbi:hypothetical protein J6590_008852 [Homalodisca vitripennis]|nr:hypothetical protein J6590_008852 [Homalodisca vitripennis]